MFGKLKAGKKNNAGTMVFVEQNKQSRGAPGSSHSACRTCRDRKLKCTGEAAGCKRCKAANIRCEYPSPTEDKRGSKSRRIQGSTAAAGPEPPPGTSNAPGQSSQSNNLQSSENAASSGLGPSAGDLDMDFSLPSFPHPGLAGGLYDDLHDTDLAGFLEGIEQDKNPDLEDPGFFQQPFETDTLADLALPTIDLAHYATSSSDSDTDFGTGTSLGDRADSNFMDLLLAPQAQWQHRDGSSSQDSMSISSKTTSKSGSRTSRTSTAPSKPTSSLSQGISPLMATLQPQTQPNKRSSPDSSSGSDSDSSGGQCRCSDRALRLLEKLPDIGNGSDSSPSSGGSSESSSPERMMDISFPPEVHSRATTNMTKANFVSAASLFLGHFSRYLAVFSTISQCQTCLRKSSFSMILLMLAQRLTGRVGLLLQKYAPAPGRESSSQKLMLSIAESTIVYEDPLPLVSTLLVGKVCRLAACIARVKAVCVMARWGSYANGFDALEAPLRERMADLEAMM